MVETITPEYMSKKTCEVLDVLVEGSGRIDVNLLEEKLNFLIESYSLPEFNIFKNAFLRLATQGHMEDYIDNFRVSRDLMIEMKASSDDLTLVNSSSGFFDRLKNNLYAFSTSMEVMGYHTKDLDDDYRS